VDVKVAEALSLLMMRINSNLNDSVAYVRDHCDPEELHWYRREVGEVMGAICLGIEEILWAEHPQLRPEQMDGPYRVDPANWEPRFYPLGRDTDEPRGGDV
jgi:hypothetical protein